ncbi:MAG: putative metal-dependent hydrolase [Cyclobacteriaceae bacterium]|nr:putative metal-dependent hydrolase [Cyclobacteriaceae bacterium]
MSAGQTDLRYPIGKFTPQASHTSSEIATCLDQIRALPAKLEAAIAGLSDSQLDTPYREGGWTVRQVVHHVADSHMNAYIRIKWTITEDTPTIKSYFEKLWAETPETMLSPVVSLSLIRPLHHKFALLLEQLSADQLQKEFLHPETQKHVAIHNMIALYAWHGAHHTAHITQLRKRMNW